MILKSGLSNCLSSSKPLPSERRVSSSSRSGSCSLTRATPVLMLPALPANSRLGQHSLITWVILPTIWEPSAITSVLIINSFCTNLVYLPLLCNSSVPTDGSLFFNLIASMRFAFQVSILRSCVKPFSCHHPQPVYRLLATGIQDQFFRRAFPVQHCKRYRHSLKILSPAYHSLS